MPYYLPLRQSIRVYPRRRAVFQLPLFPNYIFAAYGPEVRQALFRSNHIVRELRPDNQWRLLRQLVQVRRLLRADPELETVDPLVCGDLVRIRNGPFAGFEGLVERLRKKTGKRLVVLNIDIIGQAVAVEVDARLVERIAPSG